MRGAEYDEFIEEFVSAVERRWPNILLQWEDFAGVNAAILLRRYRDRLCTFNDDIQGTAAVTTGTLLAAVGATGRPLKEQTIAMFGSGSAGIGISDLLVARMKEEGLSEAEARKRIYAFNRYGLLVEGCEGIRPGQETLLRKRAEVEGWKLAGSAPVAAPSRLLDVVRNAGVTVLVGVSAQPGAFTEEIVREMASHTARPIIFPLSNPTSKAEAVPADLLALDRWPRAGRNRQPLRSGRGQWQAGAHLAGQQLLHLSRPGAGHSRLALHARLRCNDHGLRQSPGRPLAGARRVRRATAAAHRRLPQGQPGRRPSRRQASYRRRHRRSR